MRASEVIRTVSDYIKGACVVTTGVGQHQQLVAKHFKFDYPNRIFLTSGGHGAMGYELPSALGAKLTYPERDVICFAGDGSMHMNIQELITAKVYDLPILVIVLDNKQLGMVSQHQRSIWGDDPTTGDKINPNFAGIATANGWLGCKTDEIEDLKIKLRYARKREPSLIHCIVEEEDIEILK